MNMYCASDPVLPCIILGFPQKQARRQECECSLLGKYRKHIGKAACTKNVIKPATAENSWSLITWGNADKQTRTQIHPTQGAREME